MELQVKSNLKKTCCCFYVGILLLLSFIFTQPSYSQTGKETISALIKIFANAKSSDHHFNQNELAEAANYIDYRTMAERALGEKNWLGLSSVQRKNYLHSFQALIENRYYKRWHKIFTESTVSFGEEERKGTDIIVPTKIVTGKDSSDVTWTLVGQKPKVINLSLEDRDLIERVNKRFQRKINGVGLSAFVAWLQKRSQQTSDDDENIRVGDNSNYVEQ